MTDNNDKPVFGIRLARATTNFRALPLGLIALIGASKLAAFWTVQFGLWMSIILAWTFFNVTKWQRRIPRGARPWTEGAGLLPNLMPAHIRPEVLVSVGGPALQVRGGVRASIVINAATSVSWLKNPKVRLVQYAHECAHVGMGDSVIYGMLSTILLLTAIEEAYLLARGVGSELWFSLLLVALGLYSLRDYARHREISADLFAMGVVGDDIAETLESSGPGDAPRLNFLGTHPSTRTRVLALRNPLESASSGMGLAYLSTGFLTAVSVSFVYRAVLSNSPDTDAETVRKLAILAVAAISAAALSRSLQFSYYALLNRKLEVWIVLLVLGEVVGTLLARDDFRDHVTLLCAGAILLVVPTVIILLVKGTLIVSAVGDAFLENMPITGSWLQRAPLFLTLVVCLWVAMEGFWSSWLRRLVEAILQAAAN